MDSLSHSPHAREAEEPPSEAEAVAVASINRYFTERLRQTQDLRRRSRLMDDEALAVHHSVETTHTKELEAWVCRGYLSDLNAHAAANSLPYRASLIVHRLSQGRFSSLEELTRLRQEHDDLHRDYQVVRGWLREQGWDVDLDLPASSPEEVEERGRCYTGDRRR
jgi:hypothetical protein